MKPYYEDENVTLYHGDCLEITDWLSELEERYCEIAARRLAQDAFNFGESA